MDQPPVTLMKVNISSPAAYEAWYHTARGQWIAQCEVELLIQSMQPKPSESLLDVGCGTGFFSRQFRQYGLRVTGLEPDSDMLQFARTSDQEINWLMGQVEKLPYTNNSFDYVTAITSLCFVEEPQKALNEMWRVARKAVILGLLNRHSLLYGQKQGSGAYKGARWDTCGEVNVWADHLQDKPSQVNCKSTVFLPGGNLLARLLEPVLPASFPLGGFLAVALIK